MQGVPERHQYFLPTVIEVARWREGPALDVLEIGSWAGASAVTWAMALREAGASGTVTCVDPWLPYFDVEAEHDRHYRDMNDAARDGLIAQLFEHNIRCAGVADMIRQRRGYSQNVLPELPSGQFDIVYIDGSHRFEDVRFDIQQAKRLLRGGGTICGDDLERQSSEVSADELSQAIAGGRDYVYSEASRSHYHPGVTGAVGREFESVGVWDGFWAVRKHGEKWVVPDLDLTALRLPDHILRRQGQIGLLEATETHNLVESDGRYFAIHKSLGPVDLFHEQLGDRDLTPVLLTGATLDEVRRKALQVAPSAASRPAPAVPALAGSYRMFNVVTYQGRIFALRMSLGQVNVADGEDALRQRFGPEDFTVAADAATARGFIDHIELLRKNAATAAELTRHVEDLREEVRSLRASAVAGIESHSGDISTLHTAVHASGQDSDRLVERLGAETLAREKQYADLRDLLQTTRLEFTTDAAATRDLIQTSATDAAAIRDLLQAYRREFATDAAATRDLIQTSATDAAATRDLIQTTRQEFTTESAAIRDLLRAFRQELLANWADLRDAQSAGNTAFHQLQQDVRNRLRSCADEFSAKVQAVSRKQDLLSHQVTLMQYGPGSPDTICPAGEYLGFQLAYCRGHVYALRKPIDLDDINRGEQELLAAYGADDVIVGHTLDGVRARVEIAEGLREVRDGIAAVDREFLAAACQTAEGLKQLDSVVREHTHHLEKLSRRWPSRLFNN
jgi:predicted O-methyltransferase YrrM